jgi:hypothetical protein
MFRVLKSSFVVDILAFFDLATFWAIFKKIGDFFFLSSGHSGHKLEFILDSSFLNVIYQAD